MNRILLFVLSIFFLITQSCEEEKKVVRNSVDGKFIDLQEENLKLFTPTSFREFSLEEYKNDILKIEDSIFRNIRLDRFNYYKVTTGNVFFIRDSTGTKEILIKRIPYTPFTKKDSSQLLGILSLSCQEYTENSNGTCKKISAGYSGRHKTQIFKALYELDFKSYKNYNCMYVVTSNDKTFMIAVFSVEPFNFDPYLEKLIIQ